MHALSTNLRLCAGGKIPVAKVAEIFDYSNEKVFYVIAALAALGIVFALSMLAFNVRFRHRKCVNRYILSEKRCARTILYLGLWNCRVLLWTTSWLSELLWSMLQLYLTASTGNSILWAIGHSSPATYATCMLCTSSKRFSFGFYFCLAAKFVACNRFFSFVWKHVCQNVASQ